MKVCFYLFSRIRSIFVTCVVFVVEMCEKNGGGLIRERDLGRTEKRSGD